MSIQENGSKGVSTELQRVIPADIFEASRRTLRGEPVDVGRLFPQTDFATNRFREYVQGNMDWVSDTISSPEYREFNREVGTVLDGVRGRDFVFDIEDTLMSRLENVSDLSQRVYVGNPCMISIAGTLIANGNNTMLWTSATNEVLADLKKAMSPELAELPAAGRDDFEKIVKAYGSRRSLRRLSGLSGRQVLETIRSVYSGATEDNFQAGVRIFTDSELAGYAKDPYRFLTSRKYPQLFISPGNGFFVDDSYQAVDSAIGSGWRRDRVERCPMFPKEKNAIQIARAIASAFNK